MLMLEARPRPNPSAGTFLAAFSPLLLMLAPVLIKNGPAWLGQQLGTDAPLKYTLVFNAWYKEVNKGQMFTNNTPLQLNDLPKFFSLLREKVWGTTGPNYWPPTSEMAIWISKQMGGVPSAPAVQSTIIKLKSFLIGGGFDTAEAIQFGEWLHGKRTGYEKLLLGAKIGAAVGVGVLLYRNRSTVKALVGKVRGK
jgi:hypothetical protein